MPRAEKSPTAAPKRRASTKKRARLADLPPQPDPRAPLDSALFIAALQPVRKALEEDLLARAKASPALGAALTARHAEEKKNDRTADAYAVWLRRFVEQVAAAWILSCVFVRTLEDRGLLEHARIAGPGAMDSQRTFLQLAPSLSEREYLWTVFREMTRLPAASELFDAHDPVWMLAPSAEGAKTLLQLFRAGSDEAPSLRFGQADTRFLGDLYQDLNESVRERYALLQTPDFVERFILDRTLEPAIEKFGLSDTDLIDPTCGSGHFLLGAFDRLFEHHRRAEPGLPAREAARRALDKIYGADINPYAVAIAKFRLTLSYLDKAGFAHLSEAPRLPLHLAVADSLLYNPQHAQGELFHQEGAEAAKWEKRAFDFEHEREARDVLHRQYAAVVGNPPYITVKDKALRERYRALYASASGKYSLSVPFAERFFQLARPGGRVGQITANSFMKREFGKKLIEQYFGTVDLDLIVNTSGAYIPGHGTPTVLLFGSHDAPRGSTVLAVLAKRGEPTTPEDPAKGKVWSSIEQHFADVGFEDDYISVARVERASLETHPWSLAGGGASELKELLESRAEKRLGEIAEEIGFASFTGLDDAFILPASCAFTHQLEPEVVRPIVVGESVRDWTLTTVDIALTPYDRQTQSPLPLDPNARWARFLWPFRAVAEGVLSFGGKTRKQAGDNWWEWYRWQEERYRAPFRIAYAEVATHNHFALDRGGKVFKQTAPIIKLPETATEEDHLALLAYLNSSTACFWMKQVAYPKGMHNGSESNATPFLVRFAFDGSKLARLPLPPRWQEIKEAFAKLGRLADALASERAAVTFDSLVGDGDGIERKLRHARLRRTELLARLVAVQEEIDWLTYAAFGLVPRDIYEDIEHELALPLGGRPFEIAFESADPIGTDWFRWHGSKPTYPEELPSTYATRLLPNRIAHVTAGEVPLLEEPESKRRFVQPSGKAAQELETDAKILRDQAEHWVRDRLERAVTNTDAVLTVREIVGRVMEDGPLANTLLYLRRGLPPERGDYIALLDESSVPYVAALRYTDSGMEKRAAWERTWDLQRREDAGEKVGEIPVPPKYDQKDFRDPTYWRLRGKLDVPKERFISYPGCESEGDGEPVYGWAGWDHAQRAAALVALYNDRKTRESWPKERLVPMLAGLLELLPWLKQWHSEPMPDYDTTVAEAYEAFLDTELRDHAITREDLAAWRPSDLSPRRARP